MDDQPTNQSARQPTGQGRNLLPVFAFALGLTLVIGGGLTFLAWQAVQAGRTLLHVAERKAGEVVSIFTGFAEELDRRGFRDEKQFELLALWVCFQRAEQELGHAPRDWKEMMAKANPANDPPPVGVSWEALRQRHDLAWGLKLEGMAAEAQAKSAVVWTKEADPEGKRWVLFADVSARQVGAEEFAKLRR